MTTAPVASSARGCVDSAARELSLIGHAKARELTLATARRIRAAMKMPPAAALAPVLVLSLRDRV